MAAEIAEVAIDVLEDIVEDLSAQGASEDIISGLISLESEENGIGVTMQQEIESGTPEPQALKNAYNSISEISADAADTWASQMMENGYEFPSGPEEEIADFEDTSIESNPDKGELDDPNCPEGSEDPNCLAAKQGRLTKFIEFMKNYGGTIATYTAITAGILSYFIGGFLRLACSLWQRIKKACSNAPDEQKCIDTNCNSGICNNAKGMVTSARKYWVIILVVIGVVTAALTYYFRSLIPPIVGGVGALGVVALKTFLGNVFATIVCNMGATMCISSGQPINC